MGPLQLSNLLILFNVTGAGYRGHRVSHYLHLHVDSLHHPAVPGTKGNINEWLIARISAFSTQLLKLNF